jgi:HKD family nuclease
MDGDCWQRKAQGSSNGEGSSMHHVISETESFKRRLQDRLETCNEAIIATAFFTKGAFDDLRDLVEAALDRKARITFLLGRYGYVTEPSAVQGLLRLGRQSGAHQRVLFDGDFYFHYKLALFKDQGRPVVIIGSSNVTPKGLSSSGEDNVEIVGEKGLYDRLKQDLGDRLENGVDAQSALAEYTALYKKYSRLRHAIDRANQTGARVLRTSRRRRVITPRLDSSTMTQMPYCNIIGFEPDRKIIQNAARVVSSADKSGPSFPNTWFKTTQQDWRRYKRGRPFLMADDKAKNLGVAICTKPDSVLDSTSRHAYIVFFRYMRGRKFHFKNRKSYERQRSQLRAGNKYVLGTAAIRAAEKVLNALARKRIVPVHG